MNLQVNFRILIFLLIPSGMMIQPSYSALPDIRISTVGDWGCTSNTGKTVGNINAKNPNNVLALGDYSYASTATCWLNAIKPIDSKTKINIGNHDDESSSLLNSFKNHFGLSNQYYSFNQQYVHILTMSTEQSTSSGSAQYNFVRNDLIAASQNPNIKWIIVNMHKPIYSSPNTCGDSACQGSSSLRDTYHQLFDQYGVDIVLEGHTHNYQRTYPLKYDPSSPSSPTRSSTNLDTYANPEGEIYAIVGTGGINFHGLSGKAYFTAKQQDGLFGVLDLRFTNDGTKLEGKFYPNDGTKPIQDQFTITKSASDATAPTVTSTTPASGATGVAATSSITATFSEAVQPSTVSTSTFTLKDSTGTSIAGSVSLNGLVATFSPASPLLASKSYTATVTTGVKDIAGNLLTPEKSWSFTTAAGSSSSSSCTDNLAIASATSSGNQVTFVATNAIDNNFNTKWWSNNAPNPWIQSTLISQTSVCSVDIAWSDGGSRQYSFTISTSTDGISFSNVFTGKSSDTSTSPQKYSFSETPAKFVRITITQSTPGATNSIAQISEIDIFGKTSASSASVSSSSASDNHLTSRSTVSESRNVKGPEENQKEGLSISATQNRAPVASDDRYFISSNRPLLATVLNNDKDSDGDNLIVMSVLPSTNKGGTVTINANGTITYLPATNFVGVDTFTYVISDSTGKMDKAKVTVIIKGGTNTNHDQTNQQTGIVTSHQPGQNENEKIPNTKADNSPGGQPKVPSPQNDRLTNETSVSG